MSDKSDLNIPHDRQLVSLAWIAARWSCSRQTCRRILRHHGVAAVYLGGSARNATIRFDLEDVKAVERQAAPSSRHASPPER